MQYHTIPRRQITYRIVLSICRITFIDTKLRISFTVPFVYFYGTRQDNNRSCPTKNLMGWDETRRDDELVP